MKGRYVLSLAVIFLALAGYYFLFETSIAPRPEKTQQETKIFSLAPWDVKALRVVALDGRELFCEREGESWRLWKGTPADDVQSKVEDFLEALLATQQIDRFDRRDTSPTDYGIDAPDHAITITDRTDKDYQLLLGGATPSGTSIYAKFAESPDMLVVGALLKWEIQKVEPLLAAAGPSRPQGNE